MKKELMIGLLAVIAISTPSRSFAKDGLWERTKARFGRDEKPIEISWPAGRQSKELELQYQKLNQLIRERDKIANQIKDTENLIQRMGGRV